MATLVLYTRDLAERRDELKQLILDDSNERFNTEHEEFEDIDLFLNDEASECITQEEKDDFYFYWEDELNEIAEIDKIESECSEFHFGCTLIHEDYFKEYCEELCEDCGYISKDLPSFIEIDWSATAHNMKADYSAITYQGETYLYRN